MSSSVGTLIRLLHFFISVVSKAKGTPFFRSLWFFRLCPRDMNPSELVFTKEDLLKLKEYFKKEIKSNRRLEEISTIEELYEVLEDRDALTDVVLLEAEPKFQKFVQFKRIKVSNCEKLVLPQAVVKLITENYPDDWQKFGLHLKLPLEMMNQCQNIEDVFVSFTENCEGMSPQEMSFRLLRALKKCDKHILSCRVLELMRS